MAQRTVFPTLPNIADAQYLGIIATMFGELSRRGGPVPFKDFRDWAKERNLYNKDEFPELLAMIGCPSKPDVTLGDFGKKFLAEGTPEAQQKSLYKWLWAWNPILIKAVFEQLDVDGGGRLHSTHELYRYITSYAYPGAYITLINFQNWIKWMAATGHIRYIGIRWGLGDPGKKEIQAVRSFDVDEFLEDEADAKTAADAVPAVPAVAATSSAAPAVPTAAVTPDGLDEELPDAPPEAPLPTWEEPAATTGASPVPTSAPHAEPAKPTAPPATGTAQPPIGTAPARPTASAPMAPQGFSGAVAFGGVATPVWFGAGPGVEPITARELGFEAAQYGQNPSLFLFELAIAARLVTGGVPAAAYRPLLGWLRQERFWQRWVGDDKPLEDVLEALGWLQNNASHRAVFGWVALDLIRLRKMFRAHPSLATRLEESRPADALVTVQNKLFDGALTGAAFWLHREMVGLDLWDAG